MWNVELHNDNYRCTAELNKQICDNEMCQYDTSGQVLRKIFSVHAISIWFKMTEVVTVDYCGCEYMAHCRCCVSVLSTHG